MGVSGTRVTLAGCILGTAVLVVLAVPSAGDSDPRGGSGDYPWTVVAQPFDVHLAEQAEFAARESATLSSALPGNKAQLIDLLPEGSRVGPGDVVARFDQSTFVEELERIEIDLEDARAQLQKAATELELKRQELATRLQELATQVDVATLDHRRLVEIDAPFKRETALLELAEADNELEQAAKALQTMVKLHEHGYASGEELRSTRESRAKARDRAQLARARLQLLESVGNPADIEQSRLRLEQIAIEREAFERDMPREVRLKEALLERARLKVAQLEARQARTQSYLDSSEVTSPVEGFVSYPDLTFGKDRRRVQIGDSVWRSQPFAVIPDLSTLVAHVAIREADIGGVKPGQQAQLWPQAFTDRALGGSVLSVGSMTQDEDETGNRRFLVTVALDERDPRLRPGMTARVRIHTHDYAAVPVVPADAIHFLDGQPVVYAENGADWSAVPVGLGGTDGAMVAIERGLSAGVKVALRAPHSATRDAP